MLHFIGRRSTRRIARKTPLTGLHELVRPFVIDGLGDAIAPAQPRDAVLTKKAVQHDPDLLFRRMMFAGATVISSTIFSPALLRVPIACPSVHSSAVTDEPAKLCYQIALFDLIGADVRQPTS